MTRMRRVVRTAGSVGAWAMAARTSAAVARLEPVHDVQDFALPAAQGRLVEGIHGLILEQEC